MEIAYYEKIDDGYESFPAENYVDYMTNVMPVPERHIFHLPKRALTIICFVDRSPEVKPRLYWSILFDGPFSKDAEKVTISTAVVDKLLDLLVGETSSKECEVCETLLKRFLRL